MKPLLESPEVERLETLVEEATRSSDQGVRRFVEPAHGTLRRATTRRNHIIFGRRGSGKSSLLRKAAADLTVDRRPIAYVDLEAFKGHSYPDVLLSVLIEAFERFSEWLDTAAVNPKSKTSFWNKLFGKAPDRPPVNKQRARELSQDLKNKVAELRMKLHEEDDAQIEATSREQRGNTAATDVNAQISLGKSTLSLKGSDELASSQTDEVKQAYKRSKSQFLHRHIQDYQRLFRSLNDLTEGDSFLFLDDLYHIRQQDQAQVIDYFHRIAKNHGLWLKIGTIRTRTRWYIHGDPPVGMKIGDDADEIDLDLTLEKFSSARTFLVEVLKGVMRDAGLTNLDELFAESAIDRLVLASGGVARDFLGIFRRSINAARERGANSRGPKIGAEDVNSAAGEYDTLKREEFRRDTLDDQGILEDQFSNVRDFCLRFANKNIFLLDQDATKKHRDLIEELVDLRLLHKIRSRVTISDRPGEVFEAYMLDVSQYTAARKRRELEIVEFWKPDFRERIRKTSLVYDPSKNYRELATKKKTQIEPDGGNPLLPF
jgi:hypothetical protein